jgi:hypothetical protein
MSLLKRIPSLASSFQGQPQQRAALGLVGSHRQFLRTWNACLTPQEGTVDEVDIPPTPVSARDDAYAIAGRALAALCGEPRAADRLTERPVVPPHSQRRFVVPPTPIRCSADVTGCVDLLLDRRRQRPELWGSGRGAVLNVLCTLVAEMGQNICEHSGSMGCIAVCLHGGTGGERTLVSVGIVDAGVGIRASIVARLRAVGQPADLSDAEAIGRAMELPYPVNTQHRGAGLRLSRDLIHRHQGVLHIRSGSAVVSMGPSAQFLLGRCASRHVPVPGAQICVYLRP